MTDPALRLVTAEEIQRWIIDTLLQQSQVRSADLDPDKRIAHLGIDSLQLVSLVGQLETWLHCRFVTNPLERTTTIRSLSELVADQLAQGNREIDAAKIRGSTLQRRDDELSNQG